MRNAWFVVVMAVSSLADASPPAVVVRKTECTTEPSPRTPIVRAGARKKGTASIVVIGAAGLAERSWRHTGTNTIEPLPQRRRPDVAMLAGTCAITLHVAPVPRGRASFRVFGRRVRVTVD